MSNPHMKPAVDLLKWSADGTQMPAAHQANAVAMSQAQATLALAYEQRTASMIAAYNGDIAKRVEGKAAELYPLHNAICDRLGLP